MVQGTDRPDVGGDSFFRILDPRLNIFALANGMDLEKGGGVRRLTWFRDGSERGIRLTESPDGIVSITPQAWRPGHEDSERRSAAATELAEADLAREIGPVLEQAVEVANNL
ncbi:MAG: hypothetical protein P8170_07265 [Gemmatimonadota bacterium]|jgi:hypothetical protein